MCIGIVHVIKINNRRLLLLSVYICYKKSRKLAVQIEICPTSGQSTLNFRYIYYG